MAARSTRGIQSWRWACLAALVLLAGCQSKESSFPLAAESTGAPAAGALAEPEVARPADQPEITAKADVPAPPPTGTPPRPSTGTPPAGTDPDRVNRAHETLEAPGMKHTEEPPSEAPRPQSVEEFYASLPEQAIAFHVPRSVKRGEMFLVRLVVQPGQSEAALERALVEIVTDAGPAPAPGDIRTRTTRVGDEMQASISSPTLQIVPRGEDRQLVRQDAVTEWAWYVTANSGGSHRLTLSLYAIPPGRSSGIKVKTFEETLTVEVTFFDEVKDTVVDNWEWMWTFVLGPLGALAWRRRQRRHAQAG